MSNKDYRELQISSSQLVFIFLAIIILGVVIFLLGISVGKKQSEIMLAAQANEETIQEPIAQQEAIPLDKPEDKTTQVKPPPDTNPPDSQTSVKTKPQNLNWYIQVGAFRNSEGAQSVADQFKAEGYETIVLSPSPSERNGLYKVRIGGYATKELADNVKNQLIRKDPKASEYLVIQQR